MHSRNMQLLIKIGSHFILEDPNLSEDTREKVADELKDEINFLGVRLDSGDIAYLSKAARKMLDEAGYPNAKIVASNDLDEDTITHLKQQGARIDAWGVGTKLITAYDNPALGAVYKLACLEDANGQMIDRLKVSENPGKLTIPGIKKVYRIINKDTGMAAGDYIALEKEDVNSEPSIKLFHPTHTYLEKEVKNFEARDLQVDIFIDGKKVETKTVKADQSGKWEVSFTGKPKYKDGKEIKYTITEEAVNEYTTTITDFNVVNKYVPKVVEFQVTKIWDDANNQDGKRPSTIQVQLYKSIEGSVETPLPDKILTLEEKGQNNPNKWTGIFTNLPKYENGKEVSYSVKEINVPEGYVSNVVGKEITNSHTPEEIVIEGTKVWNDNNNQDGKRSKIIRVQILNGEKVVDEIEVSEKTNWTFKSKSLPKYENGKEIKYAVKEMEVKTYSTDISKDDNHVSIKTTLNVGDSKTDFNLGFQIDTASCVNSKMIITFSLKGL